MKTLDEVIKALEECMADDAIESEGIYLATDALYYLKGYRGLLKMWNDKLDKEQENQPLTWDELRAMKGPVWVEYEGYRPGWEIIENVGAIKGSAGDFTGRFVETNISILHKEDQGITWRAYRKERE